MGPVHRESGADSFVELPAPHHLRDRVLSLWVHRTADAVERLVVPDGTVHLSCTVGRDGAYVDHRRDPYQVAVPAGAIVVGARLRPGAVRLDEETRVDNDPAAELGCVLAGARSGAEAVGRLVRWLPRLPTATSADPIVQGSLDDLLDSPLRSLDGVATDTGLSVRHWRRRFTTQLGVGPKTLQRILRFQLFLARVQHALSQEGGMPSLADLAVGAGYTDQAHLGHECLRLTGSTPGTLVAGITARCAAGHDHRAVAG